MQTNTDDGRDEAVRAAVRAEYGRIARGEVGEGCGTGCCGAAPSASLGLGYAQSELDAVPDGANMGLGCGNPRAIAALCTGETVLDLGSGGGFDCFLAAEQVGPSGRVLGVDMTPDMVAKARRLAASRGIGHVEFRLGEIERLPVGDAEVDVVLSNCVINLSPDKKAVFREAFRVLKPGGRLALSDVVATSPLPDSLRGDVAGLTSCVSGAATVDELLEAMREAGFESVRVTVREESRAVLDGWVPGSSVGRYVASAELEAVKPGGGRSCCGPSCCAGASPT